MTENLSVHSAKRRYENSKRKQEKSDKKSTNRKYNEIKTMNVKIEDNTKLWCMFS